MDAGSLSVRRVSVLPASKNLHKNGHSVTAWRTRQIGPAPAAAPSAKNLQYLAAKQPAAVSCTARRAGVTAFSTATGAYCASPVRRNQAAVLMRLPTAPPLRGKRRPAFPRRGYACRIQALAALRSPAPKTRRPPRKNGENRRADARIHSTSVTSRPIHLKHGV